MSNRKPPKTAAQVAAELLKPAQPTKPVQPYVTIATRNGGCRIPVSRHDTFWDDLVEELGQPPISQDKETFEQFEMRAQAHA